MRPIRFGALIVIVLLGACSKPAPVPVKRYPMNGEVIALEPQPKDATIKAGAIADWMGPMTMEYPIRPESEYSKLSVGAHIRGTVVVQDLEYYLTDIQVDSPAK